MPVAVLVVDRHPALQELAQSGGIERLCDLRGVKRLGLVEQEPPVAVSRSHQRPLNSFDTQLTPRQTNRESEQSTNSRAFRR